jgi:hypothetical protein
MDNYERALIALKDLLPQDVTDEFTVLEVRMKENLRGERLFGSTEGTRVERFVIVDALNRLAREHTTTTFTDLSYPTAQTKPSLSVAKRAAPKALTDVLTKVIPTACYHLVSKDYPFLQICIDNTAPNGDCATLAIQVYIEGYSDVAKTTIEVKKGEHTKVTLLPVLKHAEIRKLNDLQKATLHVDVRQLAPNRAEISYTTEPIYLTAKNQALIAQEINGSIVDLTKYLAAWVTPNHPEISRVLWSACNHHPDGELRGYAGDTIEETAASIREQVRAIFATLKQDRKLAYTNSTLGWEIQPGWISQKVRLPGDCLLLERGVANCLDGTVLIASILEACGIEPLLVLVPGHAFVGWKVHPFVEQYEFLETTMKDFDQAQGYAQALYAQAQTNQAFQRELYHPRGFARLIDIRFHRTQGIYSLE